MFKKKNKNPMSSDEKFVKEIEGLMAPTDPPLESLIESVIETSVPLQPWWHRQRSKIWFTADPGYTDTRHEHDVAYEDPEGNLITSQIEGTEFHAPVIDLDFPCELRPSNTAGHYHLLMNKPMTWTKYKALLKAFLDAGLIEQGWYDSALHRKRSAIRDKGVLKYEIELYKGSLTEIIETLS